MSTHGSGSCELFDGLAFPVITVRLGNHRGTARMESYDRRMIRASIPYSYDQPDGERFARKAAEAVWGKHVTEAEARGLGDIVERHPVFVPGSTGSGYLFTVVPARLLRAAS